MNILRVTESILSYICEILMVDYRLNRKLLSTDMDFWRRAARRSKILEIRSEVIKKKWQQHKLFS
jgi:hypothetical protein